MLDKVVSSFSNYKTLALKQVGKSINKSTNLLLTCAPIINQGIITKEYQRGFKNSVSAQVVAFLAVVTLIKECYKIQKSHSKQRFIKYYKLFCLCIPTDIELPKRLLLSLHSTVIALTVNPSFSILVINCCVREKLFSFFLFFSNWKCQCGNSV